MAVDVLRANYDLSPILITEGSGVPVQLPTFSDRYTLYGFPQINSTNPPETDFPLVNDFALTVHSHRFAATPTLSQFPIYSGGVEWRTRQLLAQLGFKPDINFYRRGYPLVASSMSRITDLEPVASARNGYVHTNPLLTSHVFPYTYLTFTAPTGPIIPSTASSVLVDLAALGAAGDGLYAPFPYPRVLQAWRIWSVTSNAKAAPRGAKSAGTSTSGPDWVAIRPDGSLRVSTSIDNARFSNSGTHGSFVAQAGYTYEIQIGQSEPFSPGGAPNQRWTSAAFGNQDWVTGSPAVPDGG